MPRGVNVCKMFLRPRMNLAVSRAATSVTGIVLPGTKEDFNKGFVDIDTEKLTKYACINYLKDGKDIELKPDEEYPDWLWKLDFYTHKLKKFKDMTPDDGWLFWRQVRLAHFRKEHRHNLLRVKSFSVAYNRRGRLG